jgi:branched-chain amino acid transport system permease protein
MMCLLGGMGTFFGPFVGAAALLLIEEGFTNLTRHWQLVTGAVFMGCVLFFPRGIWGSILHWIRRGTP